MLNGEAISLDPLPSIDELEPVGPADEACLEELRGVLARHGKLNRFGVTLLHQHFPLDETEVLVEAVDEVNRTLTIRPKAIEDVAASIETSWRLDSPTGQQRCETRCETDRDYEGNEYHRRAHYTTS